MFVAYNCDGYSTALLTQYKNNEIYQQRNNNTGKICCKRYGQ